MKQMLTDLGTEYRNEVMKELCELMKIDHEFSTAYRHQILGSIERNHRVLNEYVRAYEIFRILLQHDEQFQLGT